MKHDIEVRSSGPLPLVRRDIRKCDLPMSLYVAVLTRRIAHEAPRDGVAIIIRRAE